MIVSGSSPAQSKVTERLALPWDIKNASAEEMILWKLQIANVSGHIGLFIYMKYDKKFLRFCFGIFRAGVCVRMLWSVCRNLLTCI